MAQYGRPGSDVSTGAWAATPLYEKIDEATCSDADYVQSANNPSSDTFECGLSSVSDPGVHTGHVLRCRVVGSGTGTIDFGLYQGSTAIATYGATAWPASFTTWTLNLSEAQAGNITDYADLRVRVIAHKTSGGLAYARCSWAELEAPDASATEHQKAVAGSLSGAGGLARSGAKGLAGTLAAAGAAAASLLRYVSASGSVTGSAVVGRALRRARVLAGSITMGGGEE